MHNTIRCDQEKNDDTNTLSFLDISTKFIQENFKATTSVLNVNTLKHLIQKL